MDPSSEGAHPVGRPRVVEPGLRGPGPATTGPTTSRDGICLLGPADPAALAHLRAALSGLLTRAGWTGDEQMRVVTAASEALSNGIEHGSRPGGYVGLEVVADAERVTLRVLDSGRPGASAPRAVPAPPPDGSIRGRGLVLMSGLADRLTLLPGAEGTEVVLEFESPAARDADGTPAHVRSRVITDVGAALDPELRSEDAGRRLAQVLVDHLGGWCAIHLAGGQYERPRLAAAVWAGEEAARARPALERAWLRAPGGPAAVIDEGRARNVPELYDDVLLGSVMCVPVRTGGRTVGAISVGAMSAGLERAGDLALLTEVAGVAAIALDNARLARSEDRYRRMAHRASDQVERLQAATSSLSSALTMEEVAEVILREGLSAVGAAAGKVVLRVRDEGRLLKAVGYPGEVARRLERFPLDAAFPVAEAIRVAEAIWLESPDEWTTRYGRPTTGRGTCGAFPLTARGRVVGAIEFWFPEGGQPASRPERTFVLTLVQQFAQALERARLYEEQRHIARTLQESLLPLTLPHIPGVDVAARYLPADEASQVGGDLYDLFHSDGAWSVVIGDVCGKGPSAAALTGLVRYTIRAAAMHEWRTSQVLQRLNEAVLPHGLGRDCRFCSVVYGRLQTTPAGARLTMVCAGHPPPLLLRVDGRLDVLEAEGTLIGIEPHPELHERTVDLAHGDALLLYTDGVIEGGSPGEPFGEERLHEVVRGCVGLDAEAVAERVVNAAVDFQCGALRDDIAVLVLRAAPDGA